MEVFRELYQKKYISKTQPKYYNPIPLTVHKPPTQDYTTILEEIIQTYYKNNNQELPEAFKTLKLNNKNTN